MAKAKPRQPKRSIGVGFQGGNPAKGEQKKDGFYGTPEDVTWTFLDWLETSGLVPNLIAPATPFHECCCGDGRMAKIIGMRHPVIATDLVHRGYGHAHGPSCDMTQATSLRSPVVVTNPPFFAAEQMLERLLSQDYLLVAMVLKTTYFNTKGRMRLFREHPPAWNLGLSWRPDFEGLGRPVLNCNWFVWTRGNTELPRYDVLARPLLPETIMPKIIRPPTIKKKAPAKVIRVPGRVPVVVPTPIEMPALPQAA